MVGEERVQVLKETLVWFRFSFDMLRNVFVFMFVNQPLKFTSESIYLELSVMLIFVSIIQFRFRPCIYSLFRFALEHSHLLNAKHRR